MLQKKPFSILICVIISFAIVNGDFLERALEETAIEDCKGHPADIFFILDSSNSIHPTDYLSQVTFLKKLVGVFEIGPQNIQVGALSFGHDVITEFNLNTYLTKETLLTAVSNIKKRSGLRTETGEALKYARLNAFTSENGGRENAIKIAIVITDGNSHNPKKTSEEAELLRETGALIYAIGVGPKIDRKELDNIATKPSNDFVIQVTNYQSLDKIKNLLAIKTCKATAPPSTIPSITTPTTTTSTTTTTTTTLLPDLPANNGPQDFNEVTKYFFTPGYWRLIGNNELVYLEGFRFPLDHPSTAFKLPLPDTHTIFTKDNELWIINESGEKILVGKYFGDIPFLGYWVLDQPGKWIWYGYPIPLVVAEKDKKDGFWGTDESNAPVYYLNIGNGVFQKVSIDHKIVVHGSKHFVTIGKTGSGYWALDSKGHKVWYQYFNGGSAESGKYVYLDGKTFKSVLKKDDCVKSYESDYDHPLPARGCLPSSPTDLVIIVDPKNINPFKDDSFIVWSFINSFLQLLNSNNNISLRIRIIHETAEGNIEMKNYQGEKDLKAMLRDSPVIASESITPQLISFLNEAFNVEGLNSEPRSLQEYLLTRDNLEEDLRQLNEDNLIELNNIRRKRAAHIPMALSSPSKTKRNRQVAVYITNGPSGRLEETLAAAQTVLFGINEDDLSASSNSELIELITVGLGGYTNPTELRAMSSCPKGTNFYSVPKNNKIDFQIYAKKISEVICI